MYDILFKFYLFVDKKVFALQFMFFLMLIISFNNVMTLIELFCSQD